MQDYSLFDEITNLSTEQINPTTENIDLASTREILNLINQEDKKVPNAVEREIPFIEQAVDIIYEILKQNGRLIYIGAGTSGRLGVIDASECPPTFGTSPETVQAIIAGGNQAMFASQEGAEDNEQQAVIDLNKKNLASIDVVCGIAASGRTPYVKSAINYAHSIGCKTIMITTSKREEILTRGINADVFICPYVGPEVIAGSTRMKSGTAQKLVMNMLTTATMIKLGKTYGNIMVDLQQTNKKLVGRSKNIIMKICNLDYNKASELLLQSDGNVKVAIVMAKTGTNQQSAINLLENAQGKIRDAIKGTTSNS
ncbi:MAG TPA: N-acetylmuramic acid 6-phosphate etherase [Bacteroidetes bacterium]|nr:N-acetylmuramic acid 6-phosphate etherase [Bacteroidota bacterium]